MSVRELKQAVSQLKKSERQELFAYLVRLKHETPEWRRATAKRLGEMRRGKVVSAEALAARVACR